MLRSDRGIIFAVIGCLALAAFGLADIKSETKPAIYCNKGTNGTHCRPQQYVNERSGIPGFFERSISNPEPKTGVDHEKRDLAAQEASAVFSFWMVVIAASSALVTLIATILLYQQIKLTREAVEDTGLATVAMQSANEIARDSAQKQLRAYITVEPLGITDFGLVFYPPAFLKIINTGQTPANRICVHNWNSIEGITFDAEHFNPAHHRNILLPGIDSEISLGPGKDMKLNLPIMIDELRTEKNRIEAGKCVIAHFGAVSYFDIYGERRETYFAFYYQYPLLDANGAKRYRLGNYMT